MNKGGTKLNVTLLILVCICIIPIIIIAVRDTSKELSTPKDNTTTAPSSQEYDVKLDFAKKKKLKSGATYAHIRFIWTNNSKNPSSFARSFRYFCFQNGVECDETFEAPMLDGDPFDNITSGTTHHADFAFILKSDSSDVELLVRELFKSDNVYFHETITLSEGD